jgi:hypothetical protein
MDWDDYRYFLAIARALVMFGSVVYIKAKAVVRFPFGPRGDSLTAL